MLESSNKIPLLIGFLTWLSLQVIGWQVNYIYWLAGFIVLVLLASTWLTGIRQAWHYKIVIWLIPTLNFLAWCGFLTIINNSLIRNLLIIIATISQWWYWQRGLPVWLKGSEPIIWRRTINVLNLITIWLLAASLYGWQAFLAWSILWPWLLWLLSSVIIVLADYYFSSLKPLAYWPVMLAGWLILGQLFLIIYFLPSSNLVLAYFLLVSYYLLSQISRNSLIKVNTAKRLRYQLIILFVGLLLVSLTAKWF